MEQFLAQNSWVIAVAVLWTLPWKAVALWRAARNGSRAWFVAILLINTLAILEIVYIFFVSRKQEAETANQAPKRIMYS